MSKAPLQQKQKQQQQQRAVMAIIPMTIPTMLPTDLLLPDAYCLCLSGLPSSQLKESISLQKASLMSCLEALFLSMEDSRLLARVALGEAEMV